MDTLKILHLIDFFSIYATLFFLIATFLVEKKGNLNGGKSWYRIGIVVCAAIFLGANVLEQNLETVEKYSLSQKNDILEWWWVNICYDTFHVVGRV